MRAFATYIEYLLVTRHYCYVPGHGAYMLAEEPSSISTEPNNSLFTAPHRVVRFSQLHYHDDGMLASLLMEAEGLSYDEACRYIERQVQLLPEHFLLEASQHTDFVNYGFKDIKVDTWAAIEQKKALEAAALDGTTVEKAAEAPVVALHPDTIAIPKYWVRRAAGIALIIICFFANFLGLNDRVAKEQQAALLDVTMFQRATLVQQDWDSDVENLDIDELTQEYDALVADDNASDMLADMVEDAETESQEVTETAAVETPDPQKWNESLPIRSMDSELAMAQSPTGRLYYIIIASCATQEDAKRALGNLHKAGYDNVGVLERDGRFRLYVNFFAQKAEAESYLTNVRGIERFHDAWMLPVRDGSLSHIIKNTYNDNQLSMELSHLNQRTERDQG